MKRSGIRRKAPITRAPLTTGRRKPLRASGETKRKKRARYAAYLRSPEWKTKRKACIERAGRRCEWVEEWWSDMHDRDLSARCTVTTRLTAHHKTYARFGNELPKDLICYCKTHHDFVEQRDFPHRRRAA